MTASNASATLTGGCTSCKPTKRMSTPNCASSADFWMFARSASADFFRPTDMNSKKSTLTR